MKITRRSIITGIEHTRDIPLTEDEYEAGRQRYHEGDYIQDAFPTLNADDREFLLTGITPEEWDEHMRDED